MNDTDRRRIVIRDAIYSRLTDHSPDLVGWYAAAMLPGEDVMWVAYGPRDYRGRDITVAVFDHTGVIDEFTTMEPVMTNTEANDAYFGDAGPMVDLVTDDLRERLREAEGEPLGITVSMRADGGGVVAEWDYCGWCGGAVVAPVERHSGDEWRHAAIRVRDSIWHELSNWVGSATTEPM